MNCVWATVIGETLLGGVSHSSRVNLGLGISHYRWISQYRWNSHDRRFSQCSPQCKNEELIFKYDAVNNSTFLDVMKLVVSIA